MHIRVRDHLLITSTLSGLVLYDIESGVPRLLRALARPGVANAFTGDPSGERLSRIEGGLFARSYTAPGQSGHWAGQRSSVGLYDLELNELASFEAPRLDDRSLALSPDGTRVASVNRGAGVIVYDARTGAQIFECPGDIGSGVSWSPDGHWIAAGDTDQGGGELYVIGVTHPEGPRRLALPAPSSRSPLYDSPYVSVFSPDSKAAFFSNVAWGLRGVTAYDVEQGEESWAEKFQARETSEDEEFWEALELDLALEGRVLLVGIEDGLRAYHATRGDPLRGLACEGASARFFAADDARRCVWFARGDALVSEPYPEDWC